MVISVTQSAAAAKVELQARPRARARNAALDHARTFLTLVVLLHHAVIPYTYFGHTDPTSFLGFDCIVLATDSFFMAMFFFLSGLFVWSGLAHKSTLQFLRDRLLRLGLPFAIAALTIIPIAYYAIELRANPDTTFSAFWWKTVTVGPWPSGPIWFIWVLLTFDTSAALLYRVSPRLLEPINRLSQRAFDNPRDFFFVFLLITGVLYIPSRLYFGPTYWFELGPFSVQVSRVLLYAAYFYVGAGIGSANFERGLLAAEGQMSQRGLGAWIVVTLVPYALLWVLITIKRQVLGNPPDLPNWYEGAYGFLFVIFSAAIMFAILSYFLNNRRSEFSVLDRMQADAYGMFLVHYPIVLWIQYWLFDLNLPAIAKATIAFVGTVLLSWGATWMLRRIPGATNML
ncbi:acyltransferase [Bradyrhizobium ontarionense]|uniref:Acyltransferase n=1 Tax=Bradyrhizobium ontarionense TaxID=2898149 RepID=A0ABY3RBR7_9BRAD|nr:acyltransferase [Bradyrhizobium sp. A19]UFZ04641.1 acyltransferase [Bradyrhizobium sp. A19]